MHTHKHTRMHTRMDARTHLCWWGRKSLELKPGRWKYTYSSFLLKGTCISKHIKIENIPISLIGEPEWAHIDHWQWSPCMESFTPCLSHPGPRDPRTSWSALCIPVYWCSHVCGLQLLALNWTARGRHELLVSAVKIIDDTWYKPRIQPTETVWGEL